MKFCVFCGKKPNGKTKEHVIPKWLIELTGDPKREINVGIDYTGKNKPFRRFAFNQFTFPACNDCNNKYSKLEAETKIIVDKILNNEKISAIQVSTFLDWMDKVRVGVWLGFILLDKNHLNIEPNFHVEKRIGQFDRVLMIEKSTNHVDRLNFSGADSPSFTFTPSAFCLSINDYSFTNISYMFLLSRRMGFPYPTEIFAQPDSNEIRL